MYIKTEIDAKYKEMELHVCNREVTPEVEETVRELHEIYDRRIAGTDSRGNRRMLIPGEIVSVYAEGQKVMILGADDTYTVSMKLYELETELGERNFVRISKSEIVNLRKIKNLDLSITGTVKLVMKNGYETYVSRRNVAKIKEKLLTERAVKNS
ncbi:MAG: LytTR family transcriptional regulator DNA-binding domain-containing protein [Lachnospiraceae bacterium]|nr:LytTR family transcriptional regulator DNA-binding domain-containing protein [Lachnospiraceae bacterium]